MKKIATLVFATAMLATAACVSEAPLGACIGAFDEGDPGLVYRTSGNNVGWGLAGFLFGPVGLVTAGVVVATELKCPRAVRTTAK